MTPKYASVILSFFKGNCSVGIHSSISTTVICNENASNHNKSTSNPILDVIWREKSARKSTSGRTQIDFRSRGNQLPVRSNTSIFSRHITTSQPTTQTLCDLARKIEHKSTFGRALINFRCAQFFFSSKQSNKDLLYFDKYQEGLFLSISNWFSKVLDCQKNRLQIEPEIKVVHPKYYKHLKKAAQQIRMGWFLAD